MAAGPDGTKKLLSIPQPPRGWDERCKPPSLALKSFYKLKYIAIERKKETEEGKLQILHRVLRFFSFKRNKIHFIYISMYITQ